ncbi:MAG: DUF4386 domain-containing protein [Caldilineaceae bacterium]|nr:DUF4386 domain-containing protein [Caldilineaceae bacterium]
MRTHRTIATSVGILFIIGTVAGILSVVATWGLLDGPNYLDKVAASAGRVMWGVLLVSVMNIALALIPALMFPILRRLNEPLAVGYVIFRGALETLMGTGLVVCWLLLLVVAQQPAAFGGTATAQGLGLLLVKMHDPILSNVMGIFFSLGALILYYLLYQARLIPRWISVWGLIAGVLTLVPSLTALSGINLDILKFVMLPQEMVMAGWLIAKGFNPIDESASEAVTAHHAVGAGIAPLRPQRG